MRPTQRHSDGQNVPHQQIVGFHVEGASPSPGPSSMLQDSLRSVASGSPTPVIIPPQFMRENSLPRTDSTASRSLAPELAASAAGKGVLRTTSVDRKAVVDVAALQAAAGSGKPPSAPTAATAASQADAASDQAAAQQEQEQQTQPALAQPTAAEAQPQAGAQSAVPAAGSAAAGGRSSGSTGGSSSTAVAAPAQPSQQQQQAVQQRGSSGGAAAGSQPPPKNPKPTSKAERRALQEAQRAAKAAAKTGAAGGGGGSSGGAGGGKAGAAAGAADGGAASKPPRVPGPSAPGRSTPSPADGGPAAAGSGSLSRGNSGAVPAAGTQAAGSSSSAAGTRAARAAAAGTAGVLHSTGLFAHLQQYRPVSVEAVLRGSGSSVHPAVLALGLRYGDGSITGSTARCVALVHALCQVVADYHTPPGKSLQRDLMATINSAVDFLVRCRPLSVSMGNAIKTLKLYISKTDPAAPEAEAKAGLLALMREWLQEKVAMADKVLVEYAVTKVYDGDVIMTYAYSQVVLDVLLSAAAAGRQFHVVVLDSRPELEGRQMLKRLLQADIPCSYVLLSGLSYIMREVSKVMLGAAAVLSNGTVLSRAGSAAVALMAHASSKPVLVCCEAFKFHERVQLDSITHNELGDPDVLAHLPPYAPAAAAAAGPCDPVKGAPSPTLKGWRDSGRLALLNLKYDAMPAEYVTMVVTEFGMIPPSSVPVILREYSQSAQLE